MSASVEFQVSPEVTTEWQRGIKADKPYRFLQLKFDGETLKLTNKLPSTHSCLTDFGKVSEFISEKESCYILFRVEDSNSWSLISYVPEDAITTKEKTLYAVSKSALKKNFGNGYFTHDWHVTTKKHLTYLNYKNETTQKKEDALSETEKVVLQGIKEEEQERVRLVAKHSPAMKTALNAVETPFSSEIQNEIQKYKDGEINFIRIGIDSSEAACLLDSKKVHSLEDVKNNLNSSLPSFYLFTHSISNIFLYYCPEKSPPNTRMVYATRMKNVREKIERTFSLKISKTVELQEAKEFMSHFDNNRSSNDSPPGGVTGFKAHTAAASPKIDKPHPLFGGPATGSGKKLVLPPRAAYQ